MSQKDAEDAKMFTRDLTLRFEDGLGEDTAAGPAAPVVQHVGDPVPQSEDRHRREVQPGQNLLITAETCQINVVY